MLGSNRAESLEENSCACFNIGRQPGRRLIGVWDAFSIMFLSSRVRLRIQG